MKTMIHISRDTVYLRQCIVVFFNVKSCYWDNSWRGGFHSMKNRVSIHQHQCHVSFHFPNAGHVRIKKSSHYKGLFCVGISMKLKDFVIMHYEIVEFLPKIHAPEYHRKSIWHEGQVVIASNVIIHPKIFCC